MGSDDPTDAGIEELHEMARKIGLRREWFQLVDDCHPHYDLFPSRRVLAVRYGAIELPSTAVYARRCSWPRRANKVQARMIALEAELDAGRVPMDHLAWCATELARLEDILGRFRRIIDGNDDDEEAAHAGR